MTHASDCAVHNAPALPSGECDCGVDTKLASYLTQENSVLHERVRKLEIALAKEREACAKVAEDRAESQAKPTAIEGHGDDIDTHDEATRSAIRLYLAKGE